jgi:CHAT domain-containing protein
VVVANPSEDLPEAEREATEVARRLQSAGWRVQDHAQAEASRAQLTDALAGAALLHYAGHGTHGGVDGWGAALLLHDGDRLEVSDILALPRVPDAVVLSGCDTATVELGTLAGGMNLSRAFVLAGAEWVIAAEGEVEDELARAMGEALYEGAVPTDDFDGPEALRRAQLRLRVDHPERWQAFRAVVP